MASSYKPATKSRQDEEDIETIPLEQFVKPLIAPTSKPAKPHPTPHPAKPHPTPHPANHDENHPHNDLDTTAQTSGTNTDRNGLAYASRQRLYLMVMADFGLSFTWLCKFAVATPYFQHTLHASAFLSHLVWIMGPLSGLFVAPIVGVLSDRCTSRLGRRRPFMLGGAVAAIVGMNIFANATKLTNGNLPLAQFVAFLSFGVLDFATNIIMFPSRALLGDLLPAGQQHDAQSAAAVVASFAEICGGAFVVAWPDAVTNVASIFAVCSFFVAVSTLVSVYVCSEQCVGDVGFDPIDSGLGTRVDGSGGEVDDDGDEGKEEEDDAPGVAIAGVTGRPRTQIEELAHMQEERSMLGELTNTISKTLQNFPRPLIKVGIVYALAWFQWFASLPFYSHWIGVDVLQGNPRAKLGTPGALAYQRGVSIFSLASMSKALLAMTFAAYYPRILACVGSIGEKVVFGFSFLAFSVVLFFGAYTRDAFVAALVISMGSVPFILTQTIPIAIVVTRYPNNLASNLGVMNLFCVLPQLIDTLYTGRVAQLFGESFLLRVASVWGFVTAIAAFLFL